MDSRARGHVVERRGLRTTQSSVEGTTPAGPAPSPSPSPSPRAAAACSACFLAVAAAATRRLVKKASHARLSTSATPSPVQTAEIATQVRLATPRESISSSRDFELR